MASDLDQLLEMGFDPEKAKLAVKKTGGLQPALEWLEKNQDKTIEEIQAEQGGEEEDASKIEVAPSDADARSLICNDCGKMFRSHAAAEFHASKTEHQNFSESTEEIAPLSEEQKKAKLEELREKARLRKAETSEQDKAERKANEQIRRKATTESQDIKEDLAKKAQIQEAAKKRAEQKADVEHRQRVLQQIEEQKAERKRKDAEEKAARHGQAPPPMAPAVPVQAPRSSAAFNEATLMLQVRGGQRVQKVFPVETTLFEVASQAGEELGLEIQSFQINMPKKTWDRTDFGMTVKEAGWVPRTALIVA